MPVRQQPTPNPDAMKFTADQRLVEGRESRSFYSAAQAASDPVAGAVFALDGVANVFMADDFLTVTRAPGAEWSVLAPQVLDAIEKALQR
jgi:hypothetical protein